MIRVGFVLTFGDGWLGGVSYFRNLLSAIDGMSNREIEAVIITGNNVSAQQLDGLPRAEVVRSEIISRGTAPWLVRQVMKRVLSRDILLERLLVKNGIDVLSHSGFLGRGASIPAIGWIPDFQHLHLPDFYRHDELKKRVAQNKDLCRYCDSVLLSSYDAQQDLKKFSPACAAKSQVLQFVADIAFETGCLGSWELQQRYGFNESYFLVPNQFWAHKNHKVIIEALHVLRASGRETTVLATGNTHDHRRPQYFQSIMEYAKKMGVTGCFKVLGVVPRQDLMGLMQGAIALINPSLFEGWSTSVEEAKSLGKRIILSDIAVHREQDPKGAIFFPAHDAQVLASAMWEMASRNDPIRDNEMMSEARESLPRRRQQFAEKYQGIVLGVAGPQRPGE